MKKHSIAIVLGIWSAMACGGGNAAAPGPAVSSDPVPSASTAAVPTTAAIPPASASAAPAAAAPPATDDASADLALAIKAYKAGEKAAFLAAAERAVKAEPTRPRALLYLASSSALNQKPDDAIAALARMVKLKVYVDVGAEEDFASLRALPAFTKLKADMDALKSNRVAKGEVAFRLKQKSFIPEGIVYDAASRSFFMSSVHERKIVKVDPKTGVAKDFTTEKDGLFAMLGLGIDAARKRLWACTSATPEMKGFTKADDGKGALLAIDLATGKVAKTFPLTGEGAHNCNDLFVDADGSVIVSDAAAGDLLMLPPEGAALTPFVKGFFRSPQGIADVNGTLYVGDWTHGLARVDRATKTARWMNGPDDLLLGGIDGLRAHAGKLVAIQNAYEPHRVVELAVDGDKVGLARTLDFNHPEMHEPTLGAVVGDDFFYVADSQWGSFDKDGKIWPDDKLFPPTVLKLRL